MDKAFGQETPPGCDPLTVLDAYDGCLLNCPYCFQRQDPVWSERIAVKMNIVEALAAELQTWPENSLVCVGSRSDPYMALEQKYHLTRQCLEVLNDHDVPVVITTKSDSALILADLDLFTTWNNTLRILVGFSNLGHYRDLSDLSELEPVRTVRELTRHGIEAEAYITPVLPGITDVEAILEHIAPNIPVYLDKLRIGGHNRGACLEYIRRHHPALEPLYADIADGGEDGYCLSLRQSAEIANRCTFTFFDS